MHEPSRGAAAFTALAPPSSSDGTALLIATVPGAGTLLLRGRGIRQVARSVTRAGVVKLTVKGRSGTQRRRDRTGKATVRIDVTYTPTDGDPNTKSKKLKLKRRPR
jgi:hypothetical protein